MPIVWGNRNTHQLWGKLQTCLMLQPMVHYVLYTCMNYCVMKGSLLKAAIFKVRIPNACWPTWPCLPSYLLHLPTSVSRIAQSVLRFATGWTFRESNPCWSAIFRACPNRPWDPPILLYNGYRIFPGVKRPGRGVDHPPHLAPRLKKEYSYSSTPPLGLRGLL